MKTFLRGACVGVGLALALLLVMAAVPSFTDFDTNQFGSGGNVVRMKSGATVTNLDERGTTLSRGNVISNASPELTLHNTSGASGFKRYTFSSSLNQLRVFRSLDDGSGSTLLGFFDTNGTFIAQAALSISGTSALYTDDGSQLLRNGAQITSSAPITNQTVVTNFVTVMKGGHVTITNNITILTNGTFTLQNLPWPSVVVVGADGNATNAILSGLTLSGNTLTASGGGSAGSTNYRSATITLAMSGSNILGNQIDWNLTNVCYTLLLTNNAFFSDVVFTNTPGTGFYQWLQLNLIQDSTGGRLVTFTNSIFQGINGTFAITTNANAFDALTCFPSPQTNGNICILPANNLKR